MIKIPSYNNNNNHKQITIIHLLCFFLNNLNKSNKNNRLIIKKVLKIKLQIFNNLQLYNNPLYNKMEINNYLYYNN